MNAAQRTTVYVSPLVKRMLRDPLASRQLVLGKPPFKIEFEGKVYTFSHSNKRQTGAP